MASKKNVGARSTRTKPEREFLLEVARIERTGLVVITAIRWWSGVACFSLVAYMVYVLAGKETSADFNVTIFARIATAFFEKTGTSISWIVTLIAVLYGVGMQRLKRFVIARTQARIKPLEQHIDPNRESSTLPPSGKTRPEDEP